MSLETERKFISYLLHDTKYIVKVSNTLTKLHLPYTYNVYTLINAYYHRHKGIIQEDYAIEYLKNRNYDNSVILNYQETMTSVNKYTHFDDAEFEAVLSSLDFDYKKASLIDMASKIIEVNSQPVDENKLNELQNLIQKQAQALSIDRDNVKDIGEVGETAKDRWEQYQNIKNNPNSLVLYSTGFKGFDSKNGGFAPGELIYVIGRQGSGKSVFLLNLAYNYWEQGINVALFSLEISEKDYMRRFDSRASGVPTSGLKRGTLTEQEEKVWAEYLHKTQEGLSLYNKKIGKLIVIDVPGICTPAFIEDKVKQLEKEYNTSFPIVISDYAGIMQPNIRQKELRHNKAQIALELKQYARRCNKVVITAEQMNRNGNKNNTIETDAVAESDAVSNHIDWGMGIKIVDMETKTQGQVLGFKTRDGEPFEINFNRKFNIMLMEEKEESYDWSYATN